MGIVADLVLKLLPGALSAEEHKRLSVLLEHASSFQQLSAMTSQGRDKFLPINVALWLLDSGGNPIRVYAVTSTGFTKALSDASSGDIIWIPAGTISGSHTITAGVKVVGASRYATILTGQITGGAASSIENLTVSRTANSADLLKAVVSPSSGTFNIHSCDISSVQSGAGNAYGISAEDDGTTVEVWNSETYGSSTGGSGYAASKTGTAAAYFFGGRAEGSTSTFNE